MSLKTELGLFRKWFYSRIQTDQLLGKWGEAMNFRPDRHKCVHKYVDGDTAILFVHGIQGSPCQFHFLTDALPENVSYCNLLLPGHGGDHLSFRHSGFDEWQNAVTSAARYLKSRYKKVYYVGHSMGCLLGLRSVYRDGVNYDGMMLIACPMKLHFTFCYLKHNWLTVFIRNSNNVFLQASVEANSITAKYPWQYFSCVHPYIELMKLIKLVRSEFGDTGCRVIAMHMEKDEIVSRRSLDMLKFVENCDKFVYSGCGHNYFRQIAGEDIIRRLKELIEK